MVILSKQLWLQVTILNSNNFLLYGVSITNGYEWFLSRSIWPIDGALTGTTTTTPNQRGHESNGNEVVLHTPELSLQYSVEVFANGPGDQGSVPGHIIPKT